jgi:hypothetical protein
VAATMDKQGNVQTSAGTVSGPVVAVNRRTIDSVLVGLGAVVAVVLAIAGGLLTWGQNFSTDYVEKELTSQQIFFPPLEALQGEERTDLYQYAGQQVTNGEQAKAYASYIDGHLDNTADGLTYAQLGAPERAARTAVTEARTAGAPAEEIAALQSELDEIGNQRNTIFKGETLRGLLLTTFAWDTIGRIAGIAAVAAFVASGIMVVLVGFGLVHLRKISKA